MHATPPVAALTALRLLTTLAAVYVISQFFRASQAVIAPELADELGLTSADLGLLAGGFFVVFALAQLVNGPLFDRFGPRRTMPALLVFAAIGSLVFASADGLWGLMLGRALMGLGCSGILVGALLVCARWFPRDRYAGLASILVASGETGNLLATSPFAAMVEAIGWRGAFLLMAAATAALCALAYVGVRDAPPGHAFHARQPESSREAWRGTIEAFRQPGLIRVIAAALVVYGAAMAIFGLWGGPYFNDIHGLDAVA
ncbi:MAG TPA: MFS transporter, partial [Alphaproteobacteria bacterium]|nr:MFS transporter [Alphaproteobacteria bacterium]